MMPCKQYKTVQRKSVQYSLSVTDKAPYRCTTGDVQSDNLKKTASQGLMYLRDVVWAFFFFLHLNSHLCCSPIGQLSQRASSFYRAHSWIGRKAVSQ